VSGFPPSRGVLSNSSWDGGGQEMGIKEPAENRQGQDRGPHRQGAVINTEGRAPARPSVFRILDRDGLRCARGEGEYALFDRPSFERLEILPASALDDITRMLNSAPSPPSRP